MKKYAFLLVVVFCLALSAQPVLAAEYLSIATGTTTGTYYPIGGAIANVVNKAYPELKVTSEASGGSVANVNSLAQENVELIIVQADVSAWAMKSEFMFSDQKPVTNMRAIASLFPEHIHLVTAKDSSIKKLADFKGKRVSVGAPGSGYEADAKVIFPFLNMGWDDKGENPNMKISHLDNSGITSRFKDNQLDAALQTIGYPAANLMDLAATKGMDLISFDDDLIKKVNQAHPYLVSSIIPAGAYQGVDHDTKTMAVMAILVCSEKLSEDVIYKFTKAMFDNLDTIHTSHARAKDITLDKATDGIAMPFHPGAVKFYKEKGINVK